MPGGSLTKDVARLTSLMASTSDVSRLLNYSVYPYVEVDAQEYPNVSLAFTFADEG